jgi:hypothetical protein
MERARTLREWALYKFRYGDKKRGAMLWQEAKDLFSKLGAQMEVDRMAHLPG